MSTTENKPHSRLWLGLLCALLCACSLEHEAPRAVDGVLDLRGWDFAEQGPVSLQGELRFAFGRLLTRDELAREVHLGTLGPGMWVGKPVHGRVLPREGFATYGLRVLLPPHTELVGLSFGELVSASEVELDGSTVARFGRVAMRAEDAVLLHHPFLLDHVVHDDAFDLVVRVSNHDHDYPGFSGLTLGRASDLHRARDRELMLAMVAVGGMMLMMLYHLGLYGLWRRDRSALYLACMCATMALFTLCTTRDLMFVLLPSLSGEGWWKLYFLAWFGGVTSFCAFLCAVLPDEFDARVLRLSVWFTVPCALFVLVARLRVYDTPLALTYQVFSVLCVVHALWVLGRALRRRREGAKTLLFGVLALCVLFLHDILIAERVIAGPYLAPMGLFTFLLAQAYLLARRFSGAFRRVEASERARTEFFHNTSHELRTPLHGILGFVELLRRGHYGTLESGARLALDKVVQLTEGLRGQVDTILDLARSRQGKLELRCASIPLNGVVHELTALSDGLRLASADLSFTRELSWDPDAEDPHFVTDRDKLVTVLRNLLGNAFKFREPGQRHHVTLRMRHAAHSLTLEVEDTGIGIPEDQQALVFEEFVQVHGDTRRAYEGTGLGLAMVKRCVDLMQGTIALSSSPGKGTRFVVKLPAQRADTALPVREEPRPARSELVPLLGEACRVQLVSNAESGVDQAPFGSLLERPTGLPSSGRLALDARSFAEPGTVLRATAREAPVEFAPDGDGSELMVVDDQPQNVEVMRELLRGAGYAVVSFEGGREALDAMRKQRPSLVLLDMMMPGFSGEDVLRAMRSDLELADLPVILLTARAAREDRIVGLSLGADDYLEKPVDTAELLLRVHNTLTRVALGRDKLLRDRSLEAARAVQAALLPDRRAFPNVSLEDDYRAAEQIGGDWFGYAHDEAARRLYIAVGDVTGHGLPAALLAGAAAGAFRAQLAALRRVQTTPAEALSSMARAVHEALAETARRTGSAMTMNLVCLELDLGRGHLLSAGHEPAYLLTPGAAQPLVAPGAAIGREGPLAHAVQSFQLAPGDGMFLYTDGLLEAPGPQGRPLSPRRLHKLLSRPDRENLKQHLVEATTSPRGVPLGDDSSFVVLRWHGPG